MYTRYQKQYSPSLGLIYTNSQNQMSKKQSKKKSQKTKQKKTKKTVPKEIDLGIGYENEEITITKEKEEKELGQLKAIHDKDDRFVFKEFISRDSYQNIPGRTIVRVTSKEDKKDYAMKIMKYEELLYYANSRSINSAYLHELNKHKCFTQIYGIDKKKPNVVVTMDYYPQKCLETIYKNIQKEGKFFDEKIILNWMIDLAEGIYHLHNFVKTENLDTISIFLVHNNIKPSNCLITEDNKLILTDVTSAGINRHLKSAIISSMTKHYYPPEDINDFDFNGRDKKAIDTLCENDKKYCGKRDMYAFGATFYEIMTHRKPIFNGSTVRDTIKQKNLKEKYSVELLDFLEKLLDINPNTRLNINEALKFLIGIKKSFVKKYPDYSFRKIIGE